MEVGVFETIQGRIRLPDGALTGPYVRGRLSMWSVHRPARLLFPHSEFCGCSLSAPPPPCLIACLAWELTFPSQSGSLWLPSSASGSTPGPAPHSLRVCSRSVAAGLGDLLPPLPRASSCSQLQPMAIGATPFRWRSLALHLSHLWRGPLPIP